MDHAALLVLGHEIYIFEDETDAYDAAIRLSERRAASLQENDRPVESTRDCLVDDSDEEEEWTCPFVIKVSDVDPVEYQRMVESAKPSDGIGV